MKIPLKNRAVDRQNTPICSGAEYNIGDKELDFAIITIKGRYPKEKHVTNIVCKESVSVHDGQGTIEANRKAYMLDSGDVALIEAGEKFYWDGCMTLSIVRRPAFTIEQHQAVG